MFSEALGHAVERKKIKTEEKKADRINSRILVTSFNSRIVFLLTTVDIFRVGPLAFSKSIIPPHSRTHMEIQTLKPLMARCRDCKTQIRIEPGSAMDIHAKTLLIRNKLGKPYHLNYTNCESETCQKMRAHKMHRPPSVGAPMDHILL